MITPGKRQIQAESSKKRLLSVADRLFVTYGFQSVSINDICREAGLTKGAFYYHFSSKDDLYRQLFIPQLDAYLDEHYAVAGDADAKTRFLCLAQCTFELGKRRGREMMAQNTISMVTQKASNLYTENRTHTRLLDEAIACAMEEGSFRARLNREGYIMLYACMMNGFLLKWEGADEHDDAVIDWDELLREAISLLIDDGKRGK
ncbi:MAG: helix-turn-helix domain-containing protein [Clostridia bacterium]|nr:helix-turn-helix domain-containing protein [Clostridia bacterium]